MWSGADLIMKIKCTINVMCLNHLKTIPCTLQFNQSVMSDPLRTHGLQHTRLPCPSPTHRTCSYSWPSSQWCHPTILSSVICSFYYIQSFPASRSFPMNQFFASGAQSIGALASVLPMNIQDWFPLGLTG